MLRTDLIDIINRGDAWAFIGSGCSVDAGGPSWADLVSKVVDRLDTPLREAVFDDHKTVFHMFFTNSATCRQTSHTRDSSNGNEQNGSRRSLNESLGAVAFQRIYNNQL
jgi:hypothetical protein